MLPNLLRLIGAVIGVVSLLHLTLGLQAEVLLGSGISESTLVDSTLDSQNRFYGVAFLLYGVLFIYCASDPARYRDILLIALGVFFLAGMARVVSILVVGWPAWPVLVLLATEILMPPILMMWIWREKKS